MPQILTLNKISPAGLSVFPAGEYTVGDAVQEPDAVLVRSASMHDMPLPPSLTAIARAGAGTNNIPVDACSKAGIVVFNTPGANANAVKELVIGAMLVTARNILPAVRWAETLSGADVDKQVEKGKGKFVGRELRGKTLGVIGLGAIGVLVANTAEAMGMHVLGFDPYLSVDSAWGISAGVRRAANLNEIFEKSDFITVHVPLVADTRGLFNTEAFNAMKRGVRLFNFSRGELVVTDDVKAALEAGQVASYTHDFPCEALLGVPGVLSIPHLGASTPESEDNCATMAAQELVSFLRTGAIRNSVNFPAADMPFSGGTRVTVVHENIPNMISQISAAFSAEGINIDNLLNKSRGSVAYTMLDVAGSAIDAAVARLRAIAGVVRVRVLR